MAVAVKVESSKHPKLNDEDNSELSEVNISDLHVVDDSELSEVNISDLHVVDNSELSEVNISNPHVADNSELSEVNISDLPVVEEDKQAEVDTKEVESVDFFKIPLTALRHQTSVSIGNGLNDEKLFPTQDKTKPLYNRDWRGLVDLLALPRPGQAVDKAGQVLRSWEKTEGATIGALLNALETIERWDIVDDNIDQINDDAKNFVWRRKTEDRVNNNDDDLDALLLNKVFTFDDKIRYKKREPLVKYNSLIIYAQADDDEGFAVAMKNRLIETAEDEAQRHVCMKLDILPGLMEKETILELIAERCSYVIVIITPNYALESPENKFMVNFAQSYSIDQSKRVIIPCIYGGVNVPLPKELKYLSKLDYNREKSMPGYNFWGRLKTSIDTTNPNDSDEETFACRKLRMINALPMPDLYEAMKEAELRRSDGAKLIEIVERDGALYHSERLKKALRESGESGSKVESKIPTPGKVVTKLYSKIYKLFTNKNQKKTYTGEDMDKKDIVDISNKDEF